MSAKIYHVDVRPLMFGGRCIPCTIGCNSVKGPLRVFHGTNGPAAENIFATFGYLRASENATMRKIGVHHSVDINTALWYAREYLLGSFSCKVIWEIQAECANVCKDWTFTKKGCSRYHVQRLWLVPAVYQRGDLVGVNAVDCLLSALFAES